MNWLLAIVLAVLALSVLRGYQRGLLRMVYSMVSWILALALVTWATPHINRYLLERTGIYERIAERCEDSIQQAVKEKKPAAAEKTKKEISPEIAKLGVSMPDNVLSSIAARSADTADHFLEKSGVYSEMAGGIAKFIVQGISSLIAMLFSTLVVQGISRLLGIVSRIPIIKGANRMAGLFAGGLCGLAIVWAAFYIIALSSAGKTGSALASYVYASPFLTMLYEHNPVVSLMLSFFAL